MVSVQELINWFTFLALVTNLRKYNCIAVIGLKYLTRLRTDLSHLCERKFKRSFLDLLNLICSYGFDIESTWRYLLHCPNCVNERITLLKVLSNINVDILSDNDSNIVRSFLCGDTSLTDLTTKCFNIKCINRVPSVQ